MPIKDPAIRRKRLVRLSIVAAVMLFLGGGIYGLFLINRGEEDVVTIEEIIAEARDAYAEEEYELVTDLLENPFNGDTTRPEIDEDAELLRMYITAREDIPMYDDRHLTRIVPPLKKLLELEPTDKPSQYQLLDTYMVLKRWGEAIDFAMVLEKQYPDDAMVVRQLGNAQREKNQRDEALASFYRATKLEPLHVQTHADIRSLLQEYGEPLDEYIALAQRVFDAHKDDPRAAIIRALAYEAEGNGVQARDLLKQASMKAPPDQDTIPILVRWLDRSELYITAGDYLQQHADPGIESQASQLAIYRAFESSAYDAMLARLKDSDYTDANTDLLAMWAYALLQAGEEERFEKLATELEGRNNLIAATWAKVLRLDQQGNTTPGEYIDTIVDALETHENEATTSYMKRHPYFTQRLGEAYMEALEFEAAYGAFIVAAQNSSTWSRPHRALAEALLKLDQPAPAYISARNAQKRQANTESGQWLVLTMAAIANPNDPLEIDRTLKQADQLDITSPQAVRVLPAVIDLLARSGKTAQAKQRITDLLAQQDTSLPAQLLESLAQLSQQHKLGLTEQIAEELETQHGMTRGLALIRARIEAKENGYASGLALLQEAAPKPATKEWQTTIAGYMITGDANEATAMLITVADNYPDELTLQLSALQASDPVDHAEFFGSAVARLRQQAGESSIHWRLHQARQRAQNPSDTEALQAAIADLARAEGLAPIHLELQLSLARCHLLLEEFEDAAEHAKTAKTILPNSAQAMILHGKSLFKLNRYDEARLDLVPIARDTQLDPNMRLDACKLLFEKGERGVVGRAVESIWSAGQANNEALVLLAQVYIEEGAFNKADQVCKALLKHPDAQAVRFVASYYRKTKRPELAEQTINTQLLAGVSDADSLMIRAEDAASLGNTDQALTMILQAAKLEPNRRSRWLDAVQLALALAEPGEAIRFAELASKYLPDDVGIASVLKHQELIDQARDDKDLIPMAVTILNDDPHRGIAVQVLRLAAKKQQPAQTANQLADLAQQHDDFKHLTELALDRLLRAELDERAYDMAPSAMARFQDSAASARVATLASFRLRDWGMLLSAANAWAQRNPQDRANADLMRAAAMNELARHDNAVKTLSPYIRPQATITADNQMLFEFYTRALVRSGDAPRAWQLLSPQLKTSSAARAITLKRISEDIASAQAAESWLTTLNTHSDEADKRFETATASFLAGQRLGNEPLVRNAQQQITGILSGSETHNIDVVYAQGQIAQYLSEWDQAEASYRKVLTSVPDNPLVLNNLSLVLTERGGAALSEALQLAKRATQLSDEDPNLMDTLAAVYLKQGKLDLALKTIDQAIALDETTADWRLTKADILEAKGEIDRATIIREQYEQRVKN